MHPSVANLLKFFMYDHLGERQQDVVRPFAQLANILVNPEGDDLGMGLAGPELATALRKLLEAKDCAVRASLERDGLV